MWCGRERRRIQGFEPIQRVGVYLDREEEDKKRNFQQKGLRKPKGSGAPFYASPAAREVGGLCWWGGVGGGPRGVAGGGQRQCWLATADSCRAL